MLADEGKTGVYVPEVKHVGPLRLSMFFAVSF